MSGVELRTIRKRLGFTLQQFAPQLGIHWNTLARFERGEINISGPVEKLARLLLQLAEKGKDEPKQENKMARKKVDVTSIAHTRPSQRLSGNL